MKPTPDSVDAPAAPFFPTAPNAPALNVETLIDHVSQAPLLDLETTVYQEILRGIDAVLTDEQRATLGVTLHPQIMRARVWADDSADEHVEPVVVDPLDHDGSEEPELDEASSKKE